MKNGNVLTPLGMIAIVSIILPLLWAIPTFVGMRFSEAASPSYLHEAFLADGTHCVILGPMIKDGRAVVCQWKACNP